MAANTALSALLSEFRTAHPCGGLIYLRLGDDNDGRGPYLYMDRVSLDEQTDEDADDLPEDTLGADLYVRLDSAVNTAMSDAALPGYKTGDKLFDLTF